VFFKVGHALVLILLSLINHTVYRTFSANADLHTCTGIDGQQVLSIDIASIIECSTCE